MQPIPFTSVIRENRTRQDYGDIPELAESIHEHGLIHPICLNHQNELIAGGRRAAALSNMLAKPEIYPPDTAHSTITQFLHSGELLFGIHYTYRPTESIDKLSELELVENVHRKNFSWQEEVIAVKKVHLLKTRAVALGQISDCTHWGQRQTGRLLNIALGSVNYALQIADKLSDPDSPLWKLGSMTEALQWIAKQRLDEASKQLAVAVKNRASVIPTVAHMDSSTPSGFLTEFNPANFQTGSDIGITHDEFGPPSTPQEQETGSKPEQVKTLAMEAEEVASRLVHNMDWLEFQGKLGKGFVDHIVCDPPFAIDMENFKQAGGQGQDVSRVVETHDAEKNKADFEPWLKACYDALKEKGFCVWFCDLEHWNYLVDLGFKIGFKVQRWPFHWVKTTSCINQRAEYNFTKSVEHAIIFRKGDARLVSAQTTNYFLGGLTTEDKQALPNHPFIKPMALWQLLLKAVALPGATVLDPFSGVGSMTRAALLGGWTPLACEVDENHYAQQLHNVAKAYMQLKK